jgi:hypothetical protein
VVGKDIIVQICHGLSELPCEEETGHYDKEFYEEVRVREHIIANWNVEDIDDVCGGVVDPLLGVAFHLTAFFGHNLSFLPFQTFDFDDILALNVRWIQILHMVGISAATVVALFLFGSQREDEGAAVYVEVLVKFLWMSWFVISGSRV